MNYELTTGKKIRIPDADIEKLMTSLDLSRDEAIETWLTDNDYEVNEEQAELNAKASAVKIQHGAKADKPKRKAPVRKPDDEKIAIIAELSEYLATESGFGAESVKITNVSKVIEFDIGENHYKIDLIRQRKPKK